MANAPKINQGVVTWRRNKRNDWKCKAASVLLALERLLPTSYLIAIVPKYNIDHCTYICRCRILYPGLLARLYEYILVLVVVSSIGVVYTYWRVSRHQ